MAIERATDEDPAAATAGVATPEVAAASLVDRLEGRHVVLVGLMGVGKTSVGKRLAQSLDLPFSDADHAIEEAAGMTIPEIFERYGEPHFRDREAKVIARLLAGAQCVLATGGGAFMNERTRAVIAERAVSVWLRADLETLMRRVKRRQDRPLLKVADPEARMRELMAERDPVYATADVDVASHDGPHESAVEATIAALEAHLARRAR
jgi:shikimate kinase